MRNVDFDYRARLIQLRNERRLNQKQFAKLIGKAQSTLNQYETRRRKISIETLAKILDSINVSFAEFFCNCHSQKRRTDPIDFDPSNIRRKHLKVVKNPSAK